MKTSYPNQVRTGILDGITDAQEARNTLHALYADASVTDNPDAYQKMGAFYRKTDNEEYIWFGSEFDGDAQDRFLMQADSSGVWVHKKENGTWSTIIQSISRGGTGASNRRNAAVNLGLEAANGQTMTSTNIPLYGYVTENATRLILGFPTHIHTYSTTRITINSLTAVLRGNKGYLDSNNAVRDLIASPFTTTVTKRHTGLFTIAVTKSSAFTNVDNNTPVCCMASYNFTLYDS